MSHTASGAFTENLPLILASASPRRSDLLADLGLHFEVLSINGAEPVPCVGDTPSEFVMKAAAAKAHATAAWLDRKKTAHALIMGFDTIVVLDGANILGKPHSKNEALDMLCRLAGREHTVHSGCCLLWPPNAPNEKRRCECFQDETKVTFENWPREVLASYVSTGDCMDKAGAYGMQGKGSFLVSRILGQWSTVVGLPILPLVKRLLSGGAIRTIDNDWAAKFLL